MTIGKAVEEAGYLLVYDKKGRHLFSFYIEPGVLLDHTETTVRVREGLHIHTYDEKGKRLSDTRIRRATND